MENRNALGTGYIRKRECPRNQSALGAGVRQEHGCNRTSVHWEQGCTRIRGCNLHIISPGAEDGSLVSSW